MTDGITATDATVGKIPIAELGKIFSGEVTVKRKKKTKLGKTPEHEFYLLIGNSMVRANDAAAQEFIKARLFGKNPPAEKPASDKNPDSLPAAEKPAATTDAPKKSFMDSFAELL